VWTDQPGLEVLYKGEYHPIESQGEEHYLICNFGDFLSSHLQGKIQSPWHRVILPKEGVRNSLVYFFYPKSDHPVVQHKVFNENKLLGLFVDQSTKEQSPWEIPETVKNMGEMYAAKWK
jgi:isopenicillin N synthase-like dioxygenase